MSRWYKSTTTHLFDLSTALVTLKVFICNLNSLSLKIILLFKTSRLKHEPAIPARDIIDI